MKFVFPIQTSNGKEFANAKEFEKILKQETIGQYGFNPSHSTFHGGVHFTKKNAPWVRNQYPIRAVADGKIVACRLNYDYPETTYDGRTLPFSNDFCLIEHEFDYKDESEQNKTFVFYSLYMHLAAIGDKKTEIEEEPIQHVLAQSWFGRAMPRIEEPANTYVKLRKGTVLILDEEAGPVECINGEQTLIFRKYTIQDNRGLIDSLTTVGNTLWLADDPTPSEQQPQFNIKGGPVETSQEPTWFYQKLTAEVIANDYINVRSDPSSNGKAGDVIGRALTGCTLTLERKRALKFYTINGQKYLMAKCEFKNGKAFKNDTANSPLTLGWVAITDENIKITGKTDALDFNSDANPVTETSISIRAGEPIGYLGRFDVLENDAEKGYVVTTRYQLHHELISLEKPPQAFLKAYYGDEKAESLQFASDNESHGYLLENGLSDFFRNLALCAKRSEVPCEEREDITVEDEQVVSVLTPTTASLLTVVQHTSEWYHKSDTSFLFKELDRIFGVNDRLQHEKDRADQLAWMQNTSIFSDSSAVWNWWPVYTVSKKTWADSAFGQLLGKVESRNDYTAYNKTKGGMRSFFNTNLTELTIEEVQDKQKERSMFAVGRFQLIPTTLNDAVIYLKLDTKSKFDKNVQDIIFNEYLIKIKRKNIISFLEGDGSVDDAIYDWAKEFASAGVKSGRKIANGIAKGGESYYSGDGYNKALLSPSEMIKVLEESKNEM